MESEATAPAEKRRASVITARQIETASLKARATRKSVWLSEPAPRGAGRLMVRCTPAGSRLVLYRYTMANGERDILKIGDYDARGISGVDLTEARERAGEWARLYQSGITELRAHIAAQEQAAQARTEAERIEAEAVRARADRGSLQALMDAYIAALEGRQACYDAAGLFRLHVTQAFPDLARAPAASVTAEQFRDVLARLIEANKGRTAAKLRSYLRAAFSMAMRAGLDPTVPGSFAAFQVTVNQIERLPSLAQFTKALDRALTPPELHAFWRRLQARPPGAACDAVTAALLLGGQRPAQLLRVTAADVDLSGGTMTLHDIKGRNRHDKPRRHVLPIVAELVPVIERRHQMCATPEAPLFSSTGRVEMRTETMAAVVAEICGDMREAGELERGPFSLRDLRRTAETHLAALGISSDVRAQIQSHGLGGIQQRHYDRHDYMPEKAAALQAWGRRLQGKAADVLPMKRKGRA